MKKDLKVKLRNPLNVAFTFFWFVGIMCILTLAYTYKNIQTQNIVIQKILNIKDLDLSINNMLGSDFSIINLDELNEKGLEIDLALKELSSERFIKSLSFGDTKVAFDDLKKSIVVKRSMLNGFLSQKAKSYEELLEISSNIRYTEEIRKLTSFYTRIIVSRLGGSFNRDLFANDIAQFRYEMLNKKDRSDMDFNVVLRLASLNDKYTEIDSSLDIIYQLNIPYKADKLIRSIKDEIEYIRTIEKVSLWILPLLLLIFLARTIYEDKVIKMLEIKNMQIEHTIDHSNNRIITIDMNSIITKIRDQIQDDIAENEVSQNKEKVSLIGKKFEVYDSQSQAIDIIGDLYHDNLKEKEYKNTYRADINTGETHEHLFATALYNKFGVMIGATIIARDFTKTFFMQTKLDNASADRQKSLYTDAQTGIANHLALINDLKKAPNAYLLYIGIDQFENIQFFYNDKTVEMILKEISSAMFLCINSHKFKGEVYHIQDDRFGIIYTGTTPKKLASTLLDYFSSTISIADVTGTADKKQDIKLDLSLHIGISLDSDTDTIERLVQARLAFQRSKQLDENIFAYEQNDENEIAYRQNQIVSRMLRNALSENKIIVECQPLYDLTKPLDDGGYALFSYEILVRMLDEEGKIHYPGEFLNVAKQAGLYLSVTKAVINKAFELVEIYDNRFSINLASSDMLNAGVRDLFIQKLENCTKAKNITIEVLESEDVEGSLDGVLAFLDIVRKAGCHVAIDDFGSGYANIAMILQLDIDYIKIDGSIVQRLPYDEDSREFLRMLANFAKSLNYTMVAEFVSSQEILDQVKALGIQYAQGYLLGKPRRLEDEGK